MNVYREGKVLTRDVGGVATTKVFTKRVIEQVHKLHEAGY